MYDGQATKVPRENSMIYVSLPDSSRVPLFELRISIGQLEYSCPHQAEVDIMGYPSDSSKPPSMKGRLCRWVET